MYIIGRLSYKTKIKLSITEHGSLLAQLSQPTTDWNFLMASLEWLTDISIDWLIDWLI